MSRREPTNRMPTSKSSNRRKPTSKSNSSEKMPRQTAMPTSNSPSTNSM